MRNFSEALEADGGSKVRLLSRIWSWRLVRWVLIPLRQSTRSHIFLERMMVFWYTWACGVEFTPFRIYLALAMKLDKGNISPLSWNFRAGSWEYSVRAKALTARFACRIYFLFSLPGTVPRNPFYNIYMFIFSHMYAITYLVTVFIVTAAVVNSRLLMAM